MNGLDLKSWVDAKNIKPEQLAETMDVSLGTVYKWFSKFQLEKRIVLALAHLGCEKAAAELSSSNPAVHVQTG